MADLKASSHHFRPSDGEDDTSLVLNKLLAVLANLFPQILPEVFREMLSIFEGESSLYVVAEQLINHQDKWVRGRWKPYNSANALLYDSSHKQNLLLIPVDERFRRHSYKKAVQTSLYQEFSALSKSAINAVLAEENHSYSRSRPTLQRMTAKSWRRKISRLFAAWRRSEGSGPELHFMVQWVTTSPGLPAMFPELRKTGDAELDQELNQSVLMPLTEKLKTEQQAGDWALALKTNEIEAKNANALYECECCFLTTVLEQMATCTESGHFICFRCLCQALNEALFGQSWGINIDHASGQIRCLAPLPVQTCAGCIPRDVSHRAISSNGGFEQIRMLESRLADEALLKSQMPLIRCPFCPYAEVNDLYVPTEKSHYCLNTCTPITLVLLLFLALSLLPLLAVCGALQIFSPTQIFPSPAIVLSNSLTRLKRLKHHPRRFRCKSPTCALPSCLLCFKIWHDPHICHESACLSLRTTIEAARTAALKRTCPRCGLGFVKDSGCNKLTCVCGYMLCYLCRKGLGKEDGGEGYRHFCQHFRPAGDKCEECSQCDLYKSEDEDRLITRAGEIAEKEWRRREGMVGVEGIGGGHEDPAEFNWWERDGIIQGFVDWWIEHVVTC